MNYSLFVLEKNVDLITVITLCAVLDGLILSGYIYIERGTERQIERRARRHAQEQGGGDRQTDGRTGGTET